MITTLNTMTPSVLRRARRRPPIIAALLALAVLLSGCGLAVKLGYGQGSAIAFRWFDGYVDFDDAQSLRVRGALDEWFAWHRRTQLSDYADLLARAQAELPSNTTAERLCAWTRDIRGRVGIALERATPALVVVAVTITPAQIGNIEKRYAEKNGEYRDEFVQRDPTKRRRAAIKREIERAEKLYGQLDDAQRELVAHSVARSPLDAELTLSERLRRQQDAAALLRRLVAARATRADADGEVRAYVQRLERSPRDDYRRYAERLVDYNCGFASALHNTTSAEQRRAAVKKLKGYEDDLRALAAEAAS